MWRIDIGACAAGLIWLVEICQTMLQQMLWEQAEAAIYLYKVFEVIVGKKLAREVFCVFSALQTHWLYF